MSNKINIAEILKDCPKGIKLYASTTGTVLFKEINNNNNEYPILVLDKYKREKSFTKDGLLVNGYSDAECILFPSYEMRDWSKFSWKKGDILVSKDGKKECIFSNFIGDNFTAFIGRHYLNCSNEDNIEYEDGCVYLTEDFSLEVEDAAKCYINTIQERLGGKLNLENLNIEPIKSKCRFKPFDKVLVKDGREGEKWKIGLFSHYDYSSEHVYVSLGNKGWKYCIPYNEQTAHLLNTTNPYNE